MNDPILDYTGAFPTSESVRITRFDIADRAGLAAMPTVYLNNGTIVDIVTGTGSARSFAELELTAGAADVTDPGQVQPADDLTRHWQIVGGSLA